MKKTLEEGINAKIDLKLQIQKNIDLQNEILESKQRLFSLSEKIAFLSAQKYLLTEQLLYCQGEGNQTVGLLREQLEQLQQVDLMLSEIISRLDVNQLDQGDIELVRLLDEVM